MKIRRKKLPLFTFCNVSFGTTRVVGIVWTGGCDAARVDVLWCKQPPLVRAAHQDSLVFDRYHFCKLFCRVSESVRKEVCRLLGFGLGSPLRSSAPEHGGLRCTTHCTYSCHPHTRPAVDERALQHDTNARRLEVRRFWEDCLESRASLSTVAGKSGNRRSHRCGVCGARRCDPGG